jgi:hypothetical protein
VSDEETPWQQIREPGGLGWYMRAKLKWSEHYLQSLAQMTSMPFFQEKWNWKEAEDWLVRNATRRELKSVLWWLFFQDGKKRNGDLIEEKNKYRCVLHEHETKDVFITKRMEKGLGELKEHIKNVHGFVPVESGVAKKAKAPDTKKANTAGTLGKYFDSLECTI